ncbi:hypothetical protein Lser_V15G19188 [Lactuca serriola]
MTVSRLVEMKAWNDGYIDKIHRKMIKHAYDLIEKNGLCKEFPQVYKMGKERYLYQAPLNKGSLVAVSDLSSLYYHPGKANILEILVLGLEESLKKTDGYPGKSEKEPPSPLMWTLFYFARLIVVLTISEAGDINRQYVNDMLGSALKHMGLYVAIMISFFAAQRSMLPIDPCVVGSQYSALQQGLEVRDKEFVIRDGNPGNIPMQRGVVVQHHHHHHQQQQHVYLFEEVLELVIKIKDKDVRSEDDLVGEIPLGLKLQGRPDKGQGGGIGAVPTRGSSWTCAAFD